MRQHVPLSSWWCEQDGVLGPQKFLVTVAALPIGWVLFDDTVYCSDCARDLSGKGPQKKIPTLEEQVTEGLMTLPELVKKLKARRELAAELEKESLSAVIGFIESTEPYVATLVTEKKD